MADASGTMAWRYDNWGRVIEEKRTVDGVPYTTTYAWDAASRLTSVTYPTEETATQGYNGRGLPYSLSSSLSGTIVASVAYNQLALPTQIDLGNNSRTTYGYWDMGGGYDTSGGYYGKLWQIKTVKVGGNTLQDMKHIWDAGSNLTVRENVKDSETESFSYDFLDRLLSVSGAYSESYAFNQIGNITSKNGISYTYGGKPHAVTQVGTTTYIYDANGNMTTRGTASLTWDAENRLVGITGSASATYVYDGDGFRVKKTEGSATVLYINNYYEKNLTTATVTLYYYLRNKMVAYKQATSLAYVYQDHLTGTSITADISGNVLGTIKYKPFGETWSIAGLLPTQKFTGQRLDDVGLYYYGARYYDYDLGRFIRADHLIQIDQRTPEAYLPLVTSYSSTQILDKLNKQLRQGRHYQGSPLDPQLFDRYSYARNNPLKFTDDSGEFIWFAIGGAAIGLAAYALTHIEEDEFDWKEAAVWSAIGASLGVGGVWAAGSPIARQIAEVAAKIGAAIGGAGGGSQVVRDLSKKLAYPTDLNKMHHIVRQPEHAGWNKLVKLTGSDRIDFQNVWTFIQQTFQKGIWLNEPGVEGGFRIVDTIKGHMVIVRVLLLNVEHNFYKLEDAWVP